MKTNRSNCKNYFRNLYARDLTLKDSADLLKIESQLKETYNPTMILDHSSFNYCYVDQQIKRITGIDAQIWKRDGIELAYDLFPSSHFEIIYKRFSDIYTFFYSLPVKERSGYIYTLNYCYRHSSGNIRWLLSEIIHIHQDHAGHTLHSIANIADITSYKENHMLELKIGKFENGQYVMKYFKKYPLAEEELKFSGREVEILLMMANGLTSKQIASQLHLSQYTVNTHRQNMLQKSNTNTPAELIYKASDQGII